MSQSAASDNQGRRSIFKKSHTQLVDETTPVVSSSLPSQADIVDPPSNAKRKGLNVFFWHKNRSGSRKGPVQASGQSTLSSSQSPAITNAEFSPIVPITPSLPHGADTPVLRISATQLLTTSAHGSTATPEGRGNELDLKNRTITLGVQDGPDKLIVADSSRLTIEDAERLMPLMTDDSVHFNDQFDVPTQHLSGTQLPSNKGRISPSLTPTYGAFYKASRVDARHGVYYDVQGNDNNIKTKIINYHKHDNAERDTKVTDDLMFLDKLPHAKDAGYDSRDRQGCLKGTRKTELAGINTWQKNQADKQLYWLRGHSGSGKSAIADTFAKESLKQGLLGASFFCSRDSSDRSDIHLIFPTLAHELAYRNEPFRESLLKIIKSRPNAGYETLNTQLDTLLVQPLKSTGLSTTIIIDALDECKDNTATSAILSVLANHIDAISRVKVFVTGRPEPLIRAGFDLLKQHVKVFAIHDVDRSSVDEDIGLFLRTHLTELANEITFDGANPSWPTDEHISIGVQKCSGLFIVASVIVKFVGLSRYNRQERLKLIIDKPESTVHEGVTGIDITYYSVFVHSIEDIIDMDRKDFLGLWRDVIGSVVFVFDLVSRSSLAQLLDKPQSDVREILNRLQSVLIVPDSDLQPIRICHKSLADYLTDASRCTDPRFYIKPSIYHGELGVCCLRLMRKRLEKNICKLDAYVLNEDVYDLPAHSQKHIGAGLKYACLSWAKHLRLGFTTGEKVKIAVELVEHFVKNQVLSWLEVLSIVGDLRSAVYLLGDLQAWLDEIDIRKGELSAITQDCKRFVLRFFDIIEKSAPHIYHSALPWTPRSSLIRTLYQDQISREVKILHGLDSSWDACTRTIQLKLFDGASSVALSENAELIAAGGRGMLEIFETATGVRQATLEGDGTAESLAFSPDGTLLVVGYMNGIVEIWDLQIGSLVGALEGHWSSVHSVAFSPCESMIASCDDTTIRIWAVSSHQCQCVLKGHSDVVVSVCWSSTGKEVISGSWDETVKLWDVSKKTCLKTFTHTAPVSAVVSSSDSRFIASASIIEEIKIFDTQTDGPPRTIETSGEVISIRFSRDGDRIMYATSSWPTSTFTVFDLKTDAIVSTFKFEGYHSTFASDGSCIVSAIARLLKVSQPDSSQQRHDFSTSHYGPADKTVFSPNGLLIALVYESEMTVRILDAVTGLCLQTLGWTDPDNNPSQSIKVYFSPDSSGVAVSSHNIHVWQSVCTTPAAQILDGPGETRDISFSPNGSQLVSLSENFCPTLTLWDLATGRRLAQTDLANISRGLSERVEFGIDGTSVVTRKNDNSEERWRISYNPIFTDDFSSEGGNPNSQSMLPMTFTPTFGEEPSPIASQASTPTLYYVDYDGEWIMDRQENRLCWMPPDEREIAIQSCHGDKVVLGWHGVIILDFSASCFHESTNVIGRLHGVPRQ